MNREFRKENNDANTCLSDDDMETRLKFFYDFRTHTSEWHCNGIKNLKYIECECERNSSYTSQIDFDNVVKEEIQEVILQNENMVRDIGLQCNPTHYETNDKRTSTKNIDLQQTFQSNSVEDQETNGQSSGNTITCRMSFHHK